ncbi:hypothetical protein [Streptomyces sp. KR80]|uniref:hypothetical protein n=1 Tax=Streptomyces sp. KR80 TaxID=3457426 RepID=UPI003FD0C0FC
MPIESYSGASARDPRAERLLARQRSIIAWCDRHLAIIHALSTLMMDAPSVGGAAMAELLTEPDDPLAPRRTRPRHTHLDAVATRGRCPDDASPLDRVELALTLIGDRTCVTASEALGLPEYAVAARLRSGLWLLFAPCHREAANSPSGNRPAATAVRAGGEDPIQRGIRSRR